MRRIPISPAPGQFPEQFLPLICASTVYDSSCSAEARVYFLEKDGGYYLKSAPKGTLRREAEMTEFFFQKGLSAQVHAYESLQQDWLLTSRISGEDCTHQMYLEDPKRLSALLGQLLRQLHDMPGDCCPVANRTAEYLAAARRNYEDGKSDLGFSLIPDIQPQDAWKIVQENGDFLKSDTLLHGDYCLPNVMLSNWDFSGFIDLGCGGMGDRHVDLYWGIWTLNYNLHTHRYRDRFLDAYGRDKINEDILPVIGAIEVFG